MDRDVSPHNGIQRRPAAETAAGPTATRNPTVLTGSGPWAQW
jgi:hypothetical protein